MQLEYRPNRRRASSRQLWIGIALWIVIAALLAATAYGLYASRHDANAWR